MRGWSELGSDCAPAAPYVAGLTGASERSGSTCPSGFVRIGMGLVPDMAQLRQDKKKLGENPDRWSEKVGANITCKLISR